MFDWFKKYKTSNNVVKFPELKKPIPPMPYTVPPVPEKSEPKVYYRFGVTDNNRLAFQMGYTEITMNKAGVQNLIDQLEFFKEQLEDEE